MTEEEFDQRVEDSLSALGLSTYEFNWKWKNVPSHGKWDLSLDRRRLVFYDGPGPAVECDIQVVGTFINGRNVWRWSWDNPSIELELRRDLEQVRAFGEQNAIERITLGSWEAADETAAWGMTAFAMKLLGAVGAYRAPNGPLSTFLLFTDARLAPTPLQLG